MEGLSTQKLVQYPNALARAHTERQKAMSAALNVDLYCTNILQEIGIGSTWMCKHE